jgi:hypothetical protein
MRWQHVSKPVPPREVSRASDDDVASLYHAKAAETRRHIIGRQLAPEDVVVLLKRVGASCGRTPADVAAVVLRQAGGKP